jgi:hypothetical protein
VLRPKSESRLVPESNRDQQAKWINETKPKQTTNKNHFSSNQNNNDQSSRTARSKQQSSERERIDLKKIQEANRPNDTAVIRIRDPVTSKVRTIFLNDKQIEELSKRHQQEKDKVYNVINTNQNTANNNNAYNNKTSLNNNNYNASNSRVNSDSNDVALLTKPRRPIDVSRQPVMEPFTEEQTTRAGNTSNDNEENFQRLLERHNAEKNKVQQFNSNANDDNNNKNYEISVV